MYAVIQAGGRQYKVTQGDTIQVDYFEAEPGARVTFDRILMTGGDQARIGTPLLDGVTVIGEVTGQERGPKLLSYKRRRRKHGSKGIRGFRSHLTCVRIEQINA